LYSSTWCFFSAPIASSGFHSSNSAPLQDFIKMLYELHFLTVRGKASFANKKPKSFHIAGFDFDIFFFS